MTRTILFPIVLLILGACFFGAYQYVTRNRKEIEWGEKEKELSEIISIQANQINSLKGINNRNHW